MSKIEHIQTKEHYDLLGKEEETVKTEWDIRKYFEQLRFDKDHHLGMGDIRLTIGMQEEICELVNRFYRCRIMSNLAQAPQLNIPAVIGSPILAKIEHINDLGKSKWYEVVYYDDGWHSYAGSKTFQDGEQVVEWKYCKDCL